MCVCLGYQRINILIGSEASCVAKSVATPSQNRYPFWSRSKQGTAQSQHTGRYQVITAHRKVPSKCKMHRHKVGSARNEGQAIR